MARTREFDVEQALERATIVFWQQGYRDTSMEQLVQATGVSRYGFYQEFGNKKELFKRCLEEYSLRKIRPGLACLAASEGELADLSGFFTMYSANIAQHGANGCLICNTATEIGETDPEVNQIVRDAYAKLIEQFEKFVIKAQARKQIRAELVPLSLSICLLGVLQGVAVMARSDFHRDTLQHYLGTIFDLMSYPT
ncbi:TetR/AcrR family transcriptional regulator [Shewanella sp. CG12_big_fil_rev_8_21_14_0_65_47_15]|jgi:TetR/AcrR family transcriptional repressor of nem operon|uniref:TetR/AcrR family transcriptional regulator n=1 Tax=Shewanella sp. CG12_big_fil_rev_8_21_14_0_65_47_15 TaxID=1975537 RepID=UPI000CC91E61|nr:TetR/AcrR family transcriptional regulator [Shewanella sp. CG12_big_fil_rev_8_21_14_0_65_47_15]PIW60833.1 MAG: hypothetical protein COW15_11305 [Shewanella sp. CG12_big_fil_rev_8_21_14_0_65_47_15]